MEWASTNGVGGARHPGAEESGVEEPGSEVLRAAGLLRWSRPDLTGALALHLCEAAVAAADRDAWLVASGWRVHAAVAVGDGRETASDVLEALSHWGDDVLRGDAAGRLRVELAILAHEAGEDAATRALLPAPVAGTEPELAADTALARLRCRSDDASDDVASDLAAAEQAWSRLGGRHAEIGAASALLVAAAIERRRGRAEQAVGHAVDGLARLDRGRGPSGALTPSGHLAAALAAEWISALIDVGRPAQAREGSGPLWSRLAEHRRTTRQLALLRLTLARAAASDPHDGPQPDPAEELERAAQEAAAADVPDLEHVCRIALGELHESAGRLDAALESIRLAVVADRRHQARATRFRAALTAAESLWPTDRHEAGQRNGGRVRPVFGDHPGETGAPPVAGGENTAVDGADVSASANGAGAVERTTILRAVRSTAPPPAEPARETNGSAAASGGRVPGRDDAAPSGGEAPAEAADPWATGSWTGRSGAGGPVDPVEGDPVDAPDHRDDDDGGRTGLQHTSTDSAGGTAPPTDRSGGPGPTDRPPVVGAPVGDPLFPVPGPAVPSPEPVSTAQVVAGPTDVGPAGTADPDTWLAAALAELDRIWGTPAEQAPVQPAPPAEAEAAGCVVVLDLSRAGERLPNDAAAATVARVAQRLADRLPSASRMRDDGPGAVSVVLPGRDRAAASEWMHRVLPGLVDGLTVDPDAAGSLLRAAVHDEDGVVGAQILQRLDGARTRTGSGASTGALAAPPERSAPRHAAPLQDGPADGPPVGAEASTTPSSWTTGTDTPVERTRAERARVKPADVEPDHRTPPENASVDAERQTVGRSVTSVPDTATTQVGVPGDAVGPEAPTGGRHDESPARRPYLPEGVVVRPGSGGRRHRRGPEPTTDTDGAPSPAPQSTEGLGLADLLAGALAAYRGI